jgi:fructose-specific phosphotransferase system IIC component
VAANGGLWYFLHRVDGFGLLEHPQLWCIPPALCVLAAAWINRRQLTAEQMTSIRYLTSMTIYVSSTADIFLNGVAEAPWLPLVLAGLSLGGIFAGILLHVRAFLFLGTSFLMLALLTIIWHAAHDLEQTWVWSASGIVAGILIIALFALFEKKRQEVLRLVDQLKEWE